MRIVVYGTLRKKQANSHWMTNGQWLEDLVIEGYQLYDLGAYPALIHGEGRVVCELYRIDAEILQELDTLKEYGIEYKRELIPTAFGNAWLYVYQHSVAGKNRIKNGDWLLRDQMD